jgi:hypothetical protein
MEIKLDNRFQICAVHRDDGWHLQVSDDKTGQEYRARFPDASQLEVIADAMDWIWEQFETIRIVEKIRQ